MHWKKSCAVTSNCTPIWCNHKNGNSTETVTLFDPLQVQYVYHNHSDCSFYLLLMCNNVFILHPCFKFKCNYLFCVIYLCNYSFILLLRFKTLAYFSEFLISEFSLTWLLCSSLLQTSHCSCSVTKVSFISRILCPIKGPVRTIIQKTNSLPCYMASGAPVVVPVLWVRKQDS